MSRFALIGAGMAGLSLARGLIGRGHSVKLFDKGRAPGGRLATRRTPDGRRFDHGAQYIRAEGEALR
ncbi:MAG: NAD(P)-binding protein, partial [Acetobacteraceae bacterium]|nr:NAD(P)-binding protein [Acetobacteraceae bacterium]